MPKNLLCFVVDVNNNMLDFEFHSSPLKNNLADITNLFTGLIGLLSSHDLMFIRFSGNFIDAICRRYNAD
jgi:hypothetical protein